MQRGMKNSRFSTNISLYLENDTRQSHSYYGMRIGKLIQETRNPDFKFTPLFDAEYLRNDTH